MLAPVILLLAALMLRAEASTCPNSAPPDPSALASLPSGKCQTYASELPGGSLSFCNGIVDYSFFMPSTFASQTEMDVLAETQLLGTNPNAALLLSILPPSCTLQLKRSVCLAVFQPCELVDLYFLDASCGTTSQCTTCGALSALPEYYPTATTPTYGSTCSGSGVSSACVVGPGKVPGMGDLTWKDINADAALCAQYNLVYDAHSQGCKATIPRTPCKSECNALWNDDVGFDPVTMKPNAACPLVSGDFNLLLLNAEMAVTDAYALDRITAMKSTQDTLGRTSVPLLLAFQLAPKCDAPSLGGTQQFSSQYIAEFTSPATGSLGELIAFKSTMWAASNANNKCECVQNAANPAAEHCNLPHTCNELASQVAMCNSDGGNALANPTVGFVNDEVPELCQKITKHPVMHQPDNSTLSGLQMQYGLASREEALGAYFVGPAPGLPTLASGRQHNDKPLCQFPNVVNPLQVFTGYDSQSCLVARVKSTAALVPGFVQGECRTKFHDLLCNQAFMKLESKTLCMLPGGCAANQYLGAMDHTLPFNFALPRFPAREMCEEMHTECAAFFSTLSPQQQGMIQQAFNCTGKVDQTCQGNGLEQSTWRCTSAFNGISSYPETEQILADLTALGVPLSVGTSLVVTESLWDNAEPGFSTCECPYPLVVPDDPSAPTITPGVCCAEVCEGSLYSSAQINEWGTFHRIVPILSILGSSFILVTWAAFRVKRTQPLTFFFAFASFNIALAFLIPSWSANNDMGEQDMRKVWCKDNTQPHVQSDGGMCVFQSIWLTYWVICACCIWLVQSIDLYLRIVRNWKSKQLEAKTKLYHAFFWGYPLIILTIILATDNAGYEPRNTWCFMRMPRTADKLARQVIELLFFYGSIIAICIVGLVMMTFVLKEIFKITARAAKHKENSKTSSRLHMFRTPIIFVLFFIAVWITIISWKFESVINTPRITQGATDWVQCLLTNFASGVENPSSSALANNAALWQYGVVNGTGCGVNYPLGPTAQSYTFLLCIIGLQGVFIFFIFGARVENFNLWREKMKLTSRKFDTTGKEDESSSKPAPTAKRTGTLLSSLGLSAASPKMPAEGGSKKKVANTASSNHDQEQVGGAAFMVNSIQSGKYMAVNEFPSAIGGKQTSPRVNNQEVAAYMQPPNLDLAKVEG